MNKPSGMRQQTWLTEFLGCRDFAKSSHKKTGLHQQSGFVFVLALGSEADVETNCAHVAVASITVVEGTHITIASIHINVAH